MNLSQAVKTSINGDEYYTQENKLCRNCRWYAEYEGVCCNGDSEHGADFVDGDYYCDEWEENDNA